MPVCWEFVGSPSLNKDTARSDALPENEDDYVDPEFYDLKPGVREVRFAAEGMTLEEYMDLQGELAERGLVVSVTDNTGRAWVGKFRSLTSAVIPGSEYVEGIQLAIEI